MRFSKKWNQKYKNLKRIACIFFSLYCISIYAGGQIDIRSIPSNKIYGGINKLEYIIQYDSQSSSFYPSDLNLLFHRIDDFNYLAKEYLQLMSVKMILVDKKNVIQEKMLFSHLYYDSVYPELISHKDYQKTINESGDIIDYYYKYSGKRTKNAIRYQYYYYNEKLKKMTNTRYITISDGDSGTIQAVDFYEEHNYIYTKDNIFEHAILTKADHQYEFTYVFDQHENLIEKMNGIVDVQTINNVKSKIEIIYKYDLYHNWIEAEIYTINNSQRHFELLIERNIEYTNINNVFSNLIFSN